MRELADISLFLRNCGQDVGGGSEMAGFNPVVSVNNNKAGMDIFFQFFGNNPLVSGTFADICSRLLSKEPVDAKAVGRLGASLGRALADLFEEGMIHTAREYEKFWQTDSKGNPFDEKMSPADRRKEKALDSDALAPCLELKDVEAIKKRVRAELPNIIRGKMGDTFDAGAEKTCEEIASKATQVFGRHMDTLRRVGPTAVEKMKEWGRMQSDKYVDPGELIPAKFPIFPGDINSAEDIETLGLNKKSFVKATDKEGNKAFYFRDQPSFEAYEEGRTPFRTQDGMAEAWLPKTLGEERSEQYIPPKWAVEGLDKEIPIGVDKAEEMTRMADELNRVKRNIHRYTSGGADNYSDNDDERAASYAFSKSWPWLAEGVSTDIQLGPGLNRSVGLGRPSRRIIRR